jgi:hypothetical protein
MLSSWAEVHRRTRPDCASDGHVNQREFLDFQSNWNFFIYFQGNKAAEDKAFMAQ